MAVLIRVWRSWISEEVATLSDGFMTTVGEANPSHTTTLSIVSIMIPRRDNLSGTLTEPRVLESRDALYPVVSGLSWRNISKEFVVHSGTHDGRVM